jgi:L-fuconolactonase
MNPGTSTHPRDTWSRRQFVQATLATTLTAVAARHVLGQPPAPQPDADSPESPGEPGGGWIDAHSHIWTPDVERYPLKPPLEASDLAPPSFTADELLQVAEAAGVSRVVLIQHHIYHGYDNSYLIDETQRRPDRFRVVGMVDDLEPDADRKMRELLPRRVTGFRITPWIHGDDRWLQTPGMEGMWKTAAETRQAICCLIDAKNLADVGRMCARFPETPVVIDHFARIGVDGNIRKLDVDQLCDLAQYPEIRVKVSAFYALGNKQPPHDELIPMIRRLLDSYGPSRLMWASDAPYQLGEPNSYRASLELITERMDSLSDQDRHWLLQGTAEATYFHL